MSSTTKPFEEKMNASVNHLIHGPAIEGSDLLAQQGRVCRRSGGEIPPAASPGEGHGIKMYLRHEASSAA